MTPKERAAMQQALDAIGDAVNKALATIQAALAEQVEQEPIRFIWNGEGWIEADDYIWKTTDDHERRILYAAPVRTKDLTDDEIYTLYSEPCSDREMVEFARAVIAADREKNRG